MCDQQSLRSACAYAQSDQSLCWSLEYSMIVKLLTEHHLEFLSLKGGCRSSSESTLVKMSNYWKSHAAAQMFLMVLGWCESHILRCVFVPPIAPNKTTHQIYVFYGNLNLPAGTSIQLLTSMR